MKAIPSTLTPCLLLLSPDQPDPVVILASDEYPKTHCNKRNNVFSLPSTSQFYTWGTIGNPAAIHAMSAKSAAIQGFHQKKLQHCNKVALNPLHKPVHKCCSFPNCNKLQQTATNSIIFINPAIYNWKFPKIAVTSVTFSPPHPASEAFHRFCSFRKLTATTARDAAGATIHGSLRTNGMYNEMSNRLKRLRILYTFLMLL
ncbi:MAG: hypothetical protein JOZ18_11365 [Chloroflexi bacterium]|nr:hypothetical protein [Chloroflexota bacterium]